jgi:DNA mismatch repair ATPase MutS
MSKLGEPKRKQSTLQETMQRYRQHKAVNTGTTTTGALFGANNNDNKIDDDEPSPHPPDSTPERQQNVNNNITPSGGSGFRSASLWDGSSDVGATGGGGPSDSTTTATTVTITPNRHSPYATTPITTGNAATSRPAVPGTTIRRAPITTRITTTPTAATTTTTTTTNHNNNNNNNKQQRWPWLAMKRDSQGRLPSHPNYDATSIYISPLQFSELKGFARQYWSIKRHCMDIILFVRCGSFYELYDLDADVGMRVGLSAMGREAGGVGQQTNMWKVGCNAASFGNWAAKVLTLGYCVGRVEEVGTAADAAAGRSRGEAKLVPRKLVQIYSPATVIEGSISDHFDGSGMSNSSSSSSSSSSLALYQQHQDGAFFGGCLVDIASAHIGIIQWHESDKRCSMLQTLLTQTNPAEVVVVSGSMSSIAMKVLKRHAVCVGDGTEVNVPIVNISPFQLPAHAMPATGDGKPPSSSSSSSSSSETAKQMTAVKDAYFKAGGCEDSFADLADTLAQQPHAALALLISIRHLKFTKTARYVLPRCQISPLPAFTAAGARLRGSMLLDSAAITTLELFESSLGGGAGSLLHVLDFTSTLAGRRKLRHWIASPLYRVADIEERQCMVTACMHNQEAVAVFQSALRAVKVDCERLLPKVGTLLADVTDRKMMQDEEDVLQLMMEKCDTNYNGTTGFAHADDPMSSFAHSMAHQPMTREKFLPVVKLIEGMQMLLDAIRRFHHLLSIPQYEIPTHIPTQQQAHHPHLTRALLLGSQVAPLLASLTHLFSFSSSSPSPSPSQLKKNNSSKSNNNNALQEEITLQPGTNQEYDSIQADIRKVQSYMESVLEREVKAGIISRINESSSAGGGSKMSMRALDGLRKAVSKAQMVNLASSLSSSRSASKVEHAVVEMPASLKDYIQNLCIDVDNDDGNGTLAGGHNYNLSMSPLLVEQQRGWEIVKENKRIVVVKVPQLTAAAEHLDTLQQAARTILASHLTSHAALFQQRYTALSDFIASVASLDVLCGLSQASHPDTAPDGCTFCLPTFAASSSSSSSSAGDTDSSFRSKMKFQGVWNPQILLSKKYNDSSNSMGDDDNDGNGNGSSSSIKIQPNDIELDDCASSCSSPPPTTTMILTGANTGGKSTLLKSCAIATIMAQLGCWVPAVHAEITPVDRIFTRIGAQDRIISGESTFAVEMHETSTILHNATASSLVLLDELGRGTSTFDGLAIAAAVVHHLATRIKCRCLFATHYHDLCRDVRLTGAMVMCHMASVVEKNQGLVPLYQLKPGPAPPDGSHGVHVAAVAGMPAGIIQRAAEVAAQQMQCADNRRRKKRKKKEEARYEDGGGGEYESMVMELDMCVQQVKAKDDNDNDSDDEMEREENIKEQER